MPSKDFPKYGNVVGRKETILKRGNIRASYYPKFNEISNVKIDK